MITLNSVGTWSNQHTAFSGMMCQWRELLYSEIKGEGIKKMIKLQSRFPGLVSFNGIVLTSLSRNFFTDLRNTSRVVCKLKQPGFFLLFAKKTGRGPSTVRGHSPRFFLTCRVDFFIISPYIWTVFLALIPLSFTSLNPFGEFFRPLKPHSTSHNWEICSQHLMLLIWLLCHLPLIIPPTSSRRLESPFPLC